MSILALTALAFTAPANPIRLPLAMHEEDAVSDGYPDELIPEHAFVDSDEEFCLDVHPADEEVWAADALDRAMDFLTDAEEEASEPAYEGHRREGGMKPLNFGQLRF